MTARYVPRDRDASDVRFRPDGRDNRVGRSARPGQPFGAPRGKCRSYDERGYCLRGDTCPYDHGPDALLVENLTPVVPAAPMVPLVPLQPAVAAPGPSSFRNHKPIDSVASISNPASPLDSTREAPMRPYRPRNGSQRARRSIAVENIPPESCTIDKVNDYFKQFGELTNIQVDWHAKRAILQYAHSDQAQAAYSSPDPIFGNRFVKDRKDLLMKLKELTQQTQSVVATATSHTQMQIAKTRSFGSAPQSFVAAGSSGGAASETASTNTASDSKKDGEAVDPQLTAELEALKAQAKLIGVSETGGSESVVITTQPFAGRGRGAFLGYGGRGRGGAALMPRRLDNRPTKFIVSNVTPDNEALLKVHYEGLAGFAQFEKHGENAALVNFHTRWQAEIVSV
eukprot:jgi/Hompol1/2535/HPOL_006040-RA